MANSPTLETTRTVGTSQRVVRSSSRCQLAFRRRCGRMRPGPPAGIGAGARPSGAGERLVPTTDSSPGIAHLAVVGRRAPRYDPNRCRPDFPALREQLTAPPIPPPLGAEGERRILRSSPGSSAAWQRACFGSRRPRVESRLPDAPAQALRTRPAALRPKISTERSRISTLRTLPVTVIGNSLAM